MKVNFEAAVNDLVKKYHRQQLFPTVTSSVALTTLFTSFCALSWLYLLCVSNNSYKQSIDAMTNRRQKRRSRLIYIVNELFPLWLSSLKYAQDDFWGESINLQKAVAPSVEYIFPIR